MFLENTIINYIYRIEEFVGGTLVTTNSIGRVSRQHVTMWCEVCRSRKVCWNIFYTVPPYQNLDDFMHSDR